MKTHPATSPSLRAAIDATMSRVPDSLRDLDPDLDLADAIEEYCTFTGGSAKTAIKLAKSAASVLSGSHRQPKIRPSEQARHPSRARHPDHDSLRSTEANCGRVAQLCRVSTAAA